MSAILLAIIGWDPKGWDQLFRALAPQHDIRLWPEHLGNPADVSYACVWRPPHGMLADVVGFAPDRLDAALRDAVDAHVLQFTSSGRGYTFRHALLAEAVYDDLLPGERVRLHAAYAAVLAERPERSRAELARHALASHDLVTAHRASMGNEEDDGDIEPILAAEEVQKLLDDLPEREAEVLRLYHLKSLNYRQISKQLGIPENSIGPILARGREMARRAAEHRR